MRYADLSEEEQEAIGAAFPEHHPDIPEIVTVGEVKRRWCFITVEIIQAISKNKLGIAILRKKGEIYFFITFIVKKQKEEWQDE